MAGSGLGRRTLFWNSRVTEGFTDATRISVVGGSGLDCGLVRGGCHCCDSGRSGDARSANHKLPTEPTFTPPTLSLPQSPPTIRRKRCPFQATNSRHLDQRHDPNRRPSGRRSCRLPRPHPDGNANCTARPRRKQLDIIPPSPFARPARPNLPGRFGWPSMPTDISPRFRRLGLHAYQYSIAFASAAIAGSCSGSRPRRSTRARARRSASPGSTPPSGSCRGSTRTPQKGWRRKTKTISRNSFKPMAQSRAVPDLHYPRPPRHCSINAAEAGPDSTGGDWRPA